VGEQVFSDLRGRLGKKFFDPRRVASLDSRHDLGVLDLDLVTMRRDIVRPSSWAISSGGIASGT
jgi:hypothetical protein